MNIKKSLAHVTVAMSFIGIMMTAAHADVERSLSKKLHNWVQKFISTVILWSRWK